MNENYDLQDLIDMPGITKLLEKFYRTTNIPNGLVGINGEILTKAGWIDACDRFHRGNPDTERLCRESNLELMENLKNGETACNLCKNGLVDYATPIVIEGHNLATLFLGQVLTEPPDMAFFRQHALRYGFEETQYLESIRNVPIVSKVQMEALMDCVVEIVQTLAASGLARLRQTKLENELRKSSDQRIQLMEKYERIFSGAQNGIFQSTTEGVLIIANPKFAEICGYDTPGDVIASVNDIGSQLFYRTAEYNYLMANLFKERALEGYEAVFKQKNNEIIVVSMNVRLIEVQEEVCVEFFIQDITQRKQNDEELKKHRKHLEELVEERTNEIEAAHKSLIDSEERFRQLFENMSSGVAVYEATDNGEDFLFKDFNKAAEKIERIQKDELIGKSISSVFPGVTEFGLVDVFKKVWRTGGPAYFPIKFYRDERIEGWRENYVYKLPSGEIVAIYDDITKRKRAEANLKESENRYRSIVEVIPDLIIKFNREGIYLDIISPTDELLFLPKEELLGLKIADIMPKEETDISMENIRKCLDDQVLQIMEYELQVPAGTKFFESRYVPFDENSVCCLIRDVTEKKRLEKEKEKLIKDLQDTLEQIKTLKGLLPICCVCKKIRDDQGYWSQIESYIQNHSEAELSHGLCPDCFKVEIKKIEKMDVLVQR